MRQRASPNYTVHRLTQFEYRHGLDMATKISAGNCVLRTAVSRTSRNFYRPEIGIISHELLWQLDLKTTRHNEGQGFYTKTAPRHKCSAFSLA